ncbi:MAG: PQQ-dependent sugar dehydrogenase [Actinomycetota bacterium]
MIRPQRRVLPFFLVAVLLAACGSGDANRPTATGPTSTEAEGPTSAPASPQPRPRDLRVRLVPVARLEQPVAMAVRPRDPALYVAEKVGRVVALVAGSGPRVVLDLSDRVSLGSEQGLLGLAFSPDARYLYVDLTDTAGDTHVIEFAFDHVIDPDTGRDVLVVDQPYSNHNGGALAFGPDGYLYVALGDGGSAGDPMGNAQSLSTLLGKLLRISPRPSGDRPYGVPPDNPFVGREGARPEIWDYGLRNPWRFSFDAATGDLWIGDVGQDAWEEIDVEVAGSGGGSNFGWNLLEGTHPFERRSVPGTVPPVFEYPNGDGSCAVTGGYVYRGQEIEGLVGAYVFADYCRGALEAFVSRDGRAAHVRALGPRVDALASFGEDADGELYVLSLTGTVFRLAP